MHLEMGLLTLIKFRKFHKMFLVADKVVSMKNESSRDKIVIIIADTVVENLR